MLYKQIILEWGQDTESGVWGLGYSPDNGKNFYVLNTTHGRKYRAEDGNRLYPYISDQIQDKIDTVVAPAKSAADSAVAYANDAIENSKVNSQAIDDINSAVSDAASDAAVARSDGLRAWNAAQSNVNLIDLNYASASAAISSARTEAIAAADEAKSSASAAQADIVVVKSDVALVQADVAATKSDVAVAKSAIADTKTSLSSQATSLSSYAAQASAAGNDITTLKSQAGQIEQDIASTKGDVSQLKVSASAASLALSDAAGNISSLQATAKSFSAALSDTNSNVASVTATAKELETKYADAAGDINQIKADAKGMTQTISNAQGDIAKLKTRADGFDTEFATANGNISKLQTDATGTTQTLANTKSDVAVLQSRADGLDAKYADAAGDINTLKTNASGFSQTLTNAQGDISTLKSTVSGVQTTLTDAQGNISTLQSDVSGLKKTTSDNAGNISTLQATAKTLTSQMSSAQGDISTLKQTASGISSQVSSLSNSAMQNRGTVNSPDFNSLTQSGYYTITSPANGKNYPTGSWGTLEVSGQVTDINGRLNQKYVSDNNGTAYTRQYNNSTKSWTAWVKVANQNDIDTLNGEITANTTAINQNKNAITLKADQTAVDKINGTVSQLQSSLTVQAGQIQEKVTSSQVTGMLAGYATQDYTQSLVTQKANDWNLNLTTLKTDVNAIKANGGGVNLLTGTAKIEFALNNNGGTQTVQKYDDETNYIQHTSNTPINNMGPWWPLTPEVGQVYTLSADVCGNGYINFFHYEGGDNGNLGQVNLTDDWQRISNTFRVNTISGNWVIYANNSTLLKVKHIKLEKGTVAHDWSPAPSDMATVTSVTNLSATVDGIKSTVANYQTDTSSHFTQLSNLIQSKVGTDDFNSLKQTVGLQTLESADIDSMNKNGHYFVHNLANSPISGWVYVDITGNGIDRIRQDVYQDSGTQHKYRRWYGTSFTDWEEGATYTEINQLQDAINLRVTKGDLISQINLQAGTALIQSNKLVLDAGTTVITGEAFIPSAAISNIQADKIQIGNSQLFSDDGTLNLINQNAGTASIKLTTGNVQGSTQPVTEFANGYNTSAIDISPVGTVVRPTLFFEDYPGQAKDTGYLGFSRHDTAELYFHTYDDTKELFRVACVTRFNQEVHVDRPIWQQGLSIASGNTIWSGSNYLAIGDHLSNSYTNVIARSFSSQSTLSSKTNIETVDPKDALDLVNRTDIRSYQYKADVAQGKTKRYTSLIIDDVNDVSQYYAPDEFTNDERTGRDDGSAVGYLFLAVQELTRRIKNLEDKLNG